MRKFNRKTDKYRVLTVASCSDSLRKKVNLFFLGFVLSLLFFEALIFFLPIVGGETTAKLKIFAAIILPAVLSFFWSRLAEAVLFASSRRSHRDGKGFLKEWFRRLCRQF